MPDCEGLPVIDETDDPLAKSRRTIESYEGYADRYVSIRRDPNERELAALRQVASIAGLGGQVLEIGSGPGYDADFLETLGVLGNAIAASVVAQWEGGFETPQPPEIEPPHAPTHGLSGQA